MNIDRSSTHIGVVETKLGDHAGNDLASANTGAGFAGALKDAFERVDGRQQVAQQKATAVDSGQSDDLIGAMLASQQASLSFSMLIQVRNKLMGAFDDVIKMQI